MSIFDKRKPPVKKGSFEDERDGQKYETVKMPDGKIWMAQNLNYKVENSWLYADDKDYEVYGRLYTWDAAKEACPPGWHVPSREEWESLVEAVGGSSVAGKKLRYDGDDDYGFSAQFGGVRQPDGKFDYEDLGGCWWTATVSSENFAYNRNMRYNSKEAGEEKVEVEFGMSVRCVKDE